MADSSQPPSPTAVPSESDLRLMVDSVADYAIFMLAPDGRVMSWNLGAQRIKGYQAADIVGRHFSIFYPPEEIAAGKPERDLAAALTDGRMEDEGWRVRKDGSRFWANAVVTALRDEHGSLRGFGKVTRDMTDRRFADQVLRESEEKFRLLVQNVADYAIFMLDPGGLVTSWNTGAQRIKGYTAQEIYGRHFSVFYPPEDVAAGKPERELQIAVAEGRIEDEGWRVRKDGSRFWANVIITTLYDEHGSLRGFGKVTRDMTERRTAERALDERGRLLAHLVQAQELERRRIAWDVHDDTIQAMVAVGMRLQLMTGGLPEEHRAAMDRLNDTVTAAISRLRNLTFHLRPPEVERDGLVNAMTAYLDQVTTGSGLSYTLWHDLEREPPYETAITIFRICQEALTNVRKHARATMVTVSMKSVDHGVLVRFADDGMGLSRPVDDPRRAEHFGLLEMRERAETAGGWWSIEGEPEGGTTVRFWLPALMRADEVRRP